MCYPEQVLELLEVQTVLLGAARLTSELDSVRGIHMIVWLRAVGYALIAEGMLSECILLSVDHFGRVILLIEAPKGYVEMPLTLHEECGSDLEMIWRMVGDGFQIWALDRNPLDSQ
jgi:hypothetical protein